MSRDGIYELRPIPARGMRFWRPRAITEQGVRPLKTIDISVITPCFNARDFVGVTVQSVADQSGPSLEHIVVDDGSTDGSGDLVAALRDRFAYLCSHVLGVNGGASAARNVGASMASGRHLMFLDADDVLTSGTLASLSAVLDSTGADIAVCGWKRLLRRDGMRWVTEAPGVALPPDDTDAALRSWIASEAWVPPCCVLWRREAFLATGGWDESISMNDDGHLIMRALADGARIKVAPTGGALYRSHGSERVSLSQSFIREDRLRSEIAVIDDIAEILTAQGRAGDFAEALSFAYHRAALAGFKAGHTALARSCETRGRSMGGRQTVSPKPVGRLLERVLGLERKETVIQLLAQAGLSTRRRRDLLKLKKIAGA